MRDILLVALIAGVDIYTRIMRVRVARWLIPEFRYCKSDSLVSDIVNSITSYTKQWVYLAVAFVASYSIILLSMVLPIRVLRWLFTPIGGVSQNTMLSFMFVGALIATPFLWMQIVLWRKASIIRRKINGHMNLKLCLSCGYDLHGAVELRCPECGNAITPDTAHSNMMLGDTDMQSM